MAHFTEERLLDILQRHAAAITVAVETGTFEGATARLLKQRFPIVHTIELQPERWRRCVEEYARTGIQFHLGDSSEHVAALAAAYADTPVCWYLDAHWFAVQFGANGRWGLPVASSVPFPLWAELDAICARNQPDVVIVDDVHAFGRSPSPDICDGWITVNRETLDVRLRPRLTESAICGDQYVAWLSTVIDSHQAATATGLAVSSGKLAGDQATKQLISNADPQASSPF